MVMDVLADLRPPLLSAEALDVPQTFLKKLLILNEETHKQACDKKMSSKRTPQTTTASKRRARNQYVIEDRGDAFKGSDGAKSPSKAQQKIGV